MNRLRVHSKQFMIVDKSNFKINMNENFKTLNLYDDITMIYDRDLSVKTYKKNNSNIIMIGIYIGDINSDEEYYKNCGRFIVIRNNEIELDATGSLGLFYSDITFRKRHGIICTTSTSLVKDILNLDFIDVSNESKLNWDPAPFSRINGMKRLFIDEKLDLNSSNTSTSIRKISKKLLSKEKYVDLLSNEMLKIIGDIRKLDRPIYLAMTGGADSRLIFSTLVHLKVSFVAFTMVLKNSESRLDAKIAKRLCDKYNIEHHSIKSEGKYDEELKKFYKHGGFVGGDRAKQYVLGNYYRVIPDDAIVLHGGCFEIGKQYYKEELEKITFSNVEEASIDLQRKFGYTDNNYILSLKEWINYRNLNPYTDIDWVDSFYIDQRRGAWGAANRQAEDCFSFDWIIVANTWKIIDILLRVPKDNRINNEFQISTMERMVPGISKSIPINPITIKKFFIVSLYKILSKEKVLYIKILLKKILKKSDGQ